MVCLFHIEYALQGSTFMKFDTAVLAMIVRSPRDLNSIASLKQLIVECYVVSAKFSNAKNCKGIRAALYKYAQEHQAYYYSPTSPMDGSKTSISYDGEDNLKIELCFEEKTKALTFSCFLETWHQRNPLVISADAITVEAEMKVIQVESDELSPVKLLHYDHADYDSPLQSLAQFDACRLSPSTCSGASLSTPLAQFQSLEDIGALTGLRPYICHVKPKAKFLEIKNKEYNQIAASWYFHQMFDGLNTVDVKTGEENLPLVAVSPLTETKEEMVGDPPRKRTRVGLELEFRDSNNARLIVLKNGSTQISDTKWKTFVHVEDADRFRECLEWKNEYTRSKWKDADKFDEEAKYRD